MTEVSLRNHMYSENVYFPDVFKGCTHDCVYCRPSFQRQAKRQKHNCKILNAQGVSKCYTFEPHLHGERLLHKSPKTVDKRFVFFPKGGDPHFASLDEIDAMFGYVLLNPQTTFFMQTKNPDLFWHRQLPQNLITGITLETDVCNWHYDTYCWDDWKNPSKYEFYSEISKAPSPKDRFESFRLVSHSRKAVTVEPILQFTLPSFVEKLRVLKPEFVYVGYDNHNCYLPEPSLAHTQCLIVELQTFTEVRLKTIRKAWWEASLHS